MPKTEESYDLIVIGAGPGGYVAALRAAQLGMRVACVEKDAALGGTCLNVGCIPSKALLDSSELYFHARKGLGEHGIALGGVALDLGAMMKRKDRVVTGLTRGIASLFKKNGVTWLRGEARLLSASRVEVRGAEKAEYGTSRILIATGSAPIELPDLPFDGERVISSTEALALARVPERLVVVGGGAIGLELGSVWNRLGAEVHVVEMLDRLVPAMDLEMTRALGKELEKQGLHFRLGARVTAARRSDAGLAVTIESSGETSGIDCNLLLVAVGRRPHTPGLGLEDIGVELDERGRIRVDGRFATNVAGVFAVGDVIAGPMLAHKAEEEGIAAVELMAGQAGHVNYEAIPNVVYTSPELACVGLSEEEAKRRAIDYRKGSFPFRANGRARCMGESEGMVKILADAATDRILGVHILGPRASDLIAEAAIAMEFSASAEDLARSVHAHPTLPEALKEAALAVGDRALHV